MIWALSLHISKFSYICISLNMLTQYIKKIFSVFLIFLQSMLLLRKEGLVTFKNKIMRQNLTSEVMWYKILTGDTLLS